MMSILFKGVTGFQIIDIINEKRSGIAWKI